MFLPLRIVTTFMVASSYMQCNVRDYSTFDLTGDRPLVRCADSGGDRGGETKNLNNKFITSQTSFIADRSGSPSLSADQNGADEQNSSLIVNNSSYFFLPSHITTELPTPINAAYHRTLLKSSTPLSFVDQTNNDIKSPPPQTTTTAPIPTTIDDDLYGDNDENEYFHFSSSTIGSTTTFSTFSRPRQLNRYKFDNPSTTALVPSTSSPSYFNWNQNYYFPSAAHPRRHHYRRVQQTIANRQKHNNFHDAYAPAAVDLLTADYGHTDNNELIILPHEFDDDADSTQNFHLYGFGLDHYHALMRISPANHTEQTCPRNYEGLLVSPRVRCYKPCTGRDNCKSRRKICACDFDCGLSCVLRRKKCPYTADDLDIVNGFVSKVGENVFRYGKLRYHCNDGYRLYTGCEGCAAARYCQGDGTWSGRAPLCLQDTECGPPPRKKAAEAIYDRYKGTFAVGHTVSYRCRNGYILRGFARAECVIDDVVFAARWSLSSFSCDPVSCGHPGGLENGYIEIEQGLHYGGKVRYHCNDGYLLGEGSATLYCKADGSWEGIKPRCTPINCPRPTPPENGYFADGSSVRTVFGSRVRFRCNPGFRFRDPNNAERVCLANGTWSAMPARCFEVDCGPIAPIPNGYVVEGSSTRLYSRIEFACDQFAIPDPNRPFINSSVCMPNGEWSHPPPVCLAACLLPKIEHGLAVPTNPKLSSDLGGANVLRHGAEINITCDDRFELQVRAVMTAPPVCQNGTFTSVSKCLPRKCPKLELGHQFAGVLLAPSLEHGAIARFVCNRGFSLTYNQSVTTAAATAAALHNSSAVVAPLDGTVRCFYGEWIGPRPECNALECMPPGPTANGTIVNGKAFLVGELGRYEYMPYIRNVGQDRQIVYLCVDDYDEDASSGRDYYLKGPSAATCIDGSWSPSEWPECVPEACDLPWAAGVEDISVKTLFTFPFTSNNKKNSSAPAKFTLRTATMPELKSSSLSSSFSTFIPTANFTFLQQEERRRRRRRRKLNNKLNRANKRETRAAKKQGSPPGSGQRPPSSLADRMNVSSSASDTQQSRSRTTTPASSARARVRQPTTTTSKVKPTNTARRHIGVKMKCVNGYFVNVDNGSATCHLGEWFPAEPKCVPFTCRVPTPPNMGFFKMQRQKRYVSRQADLFHTHFKSEQAVEAALSELNISTTVHEADWAGVLLKQAHIRSSGTAPNEFVILKTGDIISNLQKIMLECYSGYYEAVEELTCIDGKFQATSREVLFATDGIANAQCMPKSCQLPEMPDYRGVFEVISKIDESSLFEYDKSFPTPVATSAPPVFSNATRVPEHVESSLIQYWPTASSFFGGKNVLSSGQIVPHDTRVQVRCISGYEQPNPSFLPVNSMKLGIGNGDEENLLAAKKSVGETRCEFGRFVPEVPRCVHISVQQRNSQFDSIIKRHGIVPVCPQPPIIYGTFIVRNGVVTSDSLVNHLRFRRGDALEYFCYDPTHPFLNNSAAVLLAAGSSVNEMLPNWRINCSEDGRWTMPVDLKAAGVSANDVCRYLRLVRTSRLEARTKRTNTSPGSSAEVFCTIRGEQIDRHLSIFYNGSRISLTNAIKNSKRTKDDSATKVEIPLSHFVEYYCSPLGAFFSAKEASASQKAHCVGQEQWRVEHDSAFPPQCSPLTTASPFITPPAIFYTTLVQKSTREGGNLLIPASDEDNYGRLVVFPGARLMLDCIWLRQAATSNAISWKFVAASNNTSAIVTLPAASYIDQHRFRLDLQNVHSGRHSGEYFCTVDNRTSRLSVVVEKIVCPSLVDEARHKRVDLSTNLNLLGTVVRVRCSPGLQRARNLMELDDAANLLYENEIKCLANGAWSGTLDQCVPILCPPLYIVDSRVRVRLSTRQNGGARQVGSKLHFQCDQNFHQEQKDSMFYNISSTHIDCLSSGKWSGPVPHCVDKRTSPDFTSFG